MTIKTTFPGSNMFWRSPDSNKYCHRTKHHSTTTLISGAFLKDSYLYDIKKPKTFHWIWWLLNGTAPLKCDLVPSRKVAELPITPCRQFPLSWYQMVRSQWQSWGQVTCQVRYWKQLWMGAFNIVDTFGLHLVTQEKLKQSLYVHAGQHAN